MKVKLDPRPIRKWIVVERDKFKLTLYKRPRFSWEFKRDRRYKVAVGAVGHATPRGLYLINVKAKYPEWLVPDSDWARDAGLEPGTIVAGGTEENPLKERWLGVTDPHTGVGIHGTGSVESIGTRASHGCIRMRPEEVIELYRLTPLHTPVYIL